MVYNFDKIIDRKGTGAVKFDAIEKVFGKDDLLPLWVADMDFETPDFIVETMKERLEHPIFGYPTELPDYRPYVIGLKVTISGKSKRTGYASYQVS